MIGLVIVLNKARADPNRNPGGWCKANTVSAAELTAPNTRLNAIAAVISLLFAAIATKHPTRSA